MAKQLMKRIIRPATAEDRQRHTVVRQAILQEFPPVAPRGRMASPPGFPTQIRTAREARGLTRYALAKLAGIPNANTVRDIESGRDAQISTVQAVAKALGLRLELVAETV